MEDGLAKFLKANENTVYEFPMNVPDAINIKMDGINLHEKLNFRFTHSTITDILNYDYVRYIPSFVLINNEGNSVGIDYGSQGFETVAGTAGADETYVKDSGNYFYYNLNSFPVTITIEGTINVRSPLNSTSPPSGSALKVKTNRSNGFGGTMEYFLFSFNPVANTVYTFNINQTITVYPNEKLFMFGTTGTVNDLLYNFEFLPDSDLTVSFITRQPTTYIKAFRAQYLFTQMINKVTDGNYTADTSPYFELYKQKVFTCGNALRGLTDAVMLISFSVFFQDWDCFDAVGISEKTKVVRFNSKINLIDTTNVIPLSGPANETFKVSVAKEYLFNEAEFGYPEMRNDVGVANGKEEPNCKYLWSIGTTKSPAKLDKVSKIKASPYEIELVRVTTFKKDTTDNKADNDLFSLYIEATSNPASGTIPVHYALDRSLNATATGLLEPLTIFNLPLSPKRNLLRNGPFMRSSLYLAGNKVLAYKSADRNNKMVAGGIIEKSDVPVSSLGSAFFYPLYLDSDFPAADNLLDLLDANPLQVLSFPLNGYTIEGILQEVSIAPASRAIQQYKFLTLASNDLTKLIDYYG